MAEFIETGREAAFAEIVRLHAGGVFAACLRSTSDPQDAEDATQAAFLALAVRCKTGRALQRVGPWLHRVARRAASDARRSRARRRQRERLHAIEAAERDGQAVAKRRDDVDIEALRRALAEELARLPGRYRLPLVSLYFAEMSREEIAKELGCTLPNLAVRIHRGRRMLAERLSKRGIAPVGRLMLGNLLAVGIASLAGSTMLQRTTDAAVRTALGQDIAGAVSAQVLSLMRGTAAATALGKLKTTALTAVLLSAAGASGVLARAYGVELPEVPSLREVMRVLRSPLRPPTFTAPTQTLTANGAGVGPAEGDERGTGSVHPPATRHAPPDEGGIWSGSYARQPADGDPGGGPALASPAARHRSPAEAMGPPLQADSEGVKRPPRRPPPRQGGFTVAVPPSHLAQAVDRAAAPHSGRGEFSLRDSGALVRHFSADVAASDRLPTAGGSLSVAQDRGSSGAYFLRSGWLHAESQDIGRFGTGQFLQSGGVNTAVQLRLGAGAGGSGRYDLISGLLVTESAATALGAVSGIQVGGSGAGLLNLGDSRTAGTLVQPRSPPQAPGQTLAVRTEADGTGTIRGWGGAIGPGGMFVQNGQVIADGYGDDRMLIFTGYSTVTNTLDNPAGGTNGWFARDGGRLILPKIDVLRGTRTYTWGESPHDPTIDLVNSVRLTLHDVQRPGKLDISLLSPDRGDVPALPAGHTFIGVWSIDSGLTDPAGGIDLTVRYDDGLATDLGLDESVLKLWRYDAGEWLRINDASFGRDIEDKLLHGHADALTFFAVSAPEPGTAGLLLVVGGTFLLSRRRRRR